jgi:hypothetical protein
VVRERGFLKVPLLQVQYHTSGHVCLGDNRLLSVALSSSLEVGDQTKFLSMFVPLLQTTIAGLPISCVAAVVAIRDRDTSQRRMKRPPPQKRSTAKLELFDARGGSHASFRAAWTLSCTHDR